MKTLFLLADGMGDWPVDALNGKTPLEAASTPNMDALAAKSINGECRSVPPGMPPGSDVANMAMLGFDPKKFHTGRGPIEAAAQGIEAGENDLVWRMNLVTLSEFTESGLMRDYSAGHIDNSAARAIINRFQRELGDDRFTFYPGVQYRHLLVQKNGAKSPEASFEISPPHDITSKPIAKDLESYKQSEPLWTLIRKCALRLARQENTTKANSVWPWGQGRKLSLPDFHKTFSLKGAVISAVDLIKGLGRACGMEVLEVEGATGLIDTNYAGKVEAAVKFLENGDFVFLHVEAPDECGHGGLMQEKIRAIELFDEKIVAPLREAFKDDAAFIIACDHLTPLAVLTHVSDPVPFLVYAPNLKNITPISKFSEKNVKTTGVFIENGHELLSFALEAVRRE